MLGSAPHANLEREEGTFLGVGADELRRHHEARRGHIERSEIGPTESAARRPRAGRVDELIERAVWPDTSDTGSTSDSAIPEASLDVEARPVGAPSG